MNKARAKGTEFESAVTNYLIESGFEHAHRLPLGSPLGDVAGTPMTIEAKNHKEMALGTWVKQAENSSLKTGKRWAVVHKRRGKNVSQAYVTMSLETFAELLKHLT